jgi:AcrR family transcriptional regulator
MSQVNTRDRIKEAALALFAERGFAGTSIGAIEEAAGLAPRAGAFYRHFPGKQALFEELARERITETPDEFDLGALTELGDTRAQLVALAQRFEQAAERQRPWQRLIEEMRLTAGGRAFEAAANEAMLRALMSWVGTKPAGRRLGEPALAALTMTVFGGWLLYLTKQSQGVDLDMIDRDVLLSDWAARNAKLLDRM